jgi:hypothetical protein
VTTPTWLAEIEHYNDNTKLLTGVARVMADFELARQVPLLIKAIKLLADGMEDISTVGVGYRMKYSDAFKALQDMARDTLTAVEALRVSDKTK